MPQLIQRAPLGLLGILDSKAGGQNPNALLDEVRPTVDVSTLYNVSQRLSVNATIAAGAIVIGTNLFPVTLSGPQQGELWIVHRATVFATANFAAATFRFGLALIDSRNSSVSIMGTLISGAAGERPITGGPGGFIMRPGENLALWASNPAGAVNVQLTTLFDLVTI